MTDWTLSACKSRDEMTEICDSITGVFHPDDGGAVPYQDRRQLLRLLDEAREENHCVDCCCAQSWKALGITTYTGKSIPEHIAAQAAEIERLTRERDEAESAVSRYEDRIAERDKQLATAEERVKVPKRTAPTFDQFTQSLLSAGWTDRNDAQWDGALKLHREWFPAMPSDGSKTP
jgi:hypothetical protein